MGETAGARNLILGMAEDLEWEVLRPFVESLRQTSFAGEVRLFTAGANERTVRLLRDHGVVVDRFTRLRVRRGTRVFQPLRSSLVSHAYSPLLRAASLRGAASLAAPISVPSVSRYLRYYRLLSAVPRTRYANVMLTDVSDVYFQFDPFAFEIGASVNCFLEDTRETLSSEAANRFWLVTAYGDEVLSDLGSRTISCSGITIGTYDAILAYLRVMVSSLVRLRYQWHGIDQAVHNYVIYKGLLPEVKLVENGEGPVLTLGIVPSAEVSAALPDGYDNVPILHQYDRHPELQEVLLRRLDHRP
ncbi:MAG TPA: hypothetical protein VMT59_09965 [Gaiellaceae bacterium]|nr:hypothetical protein [Gaiellaceae bacterium]